MLTKRTYVGASGIAASAELIFVSDQPEGKEVLNGVPFSGVGKFEFNNCLKAAGLNRSRQYLTNVFKDVDRCKFDYCKPAWKSKKVEEYILSQDGQEYVELLKNELSRCKAKVIVAVGDIALFCLTNRVGIWKWRGSVLRCELVPGKLVVPIYDPITVVKGRYLNERLIILDLLKAKRVSKKDWKRKTYNMKIRPSFVQVMSFLKKVSRQKLTDFDIETFKAEISCFGFTISDEGGKTESLCIPLIEGEREYFNPVEEYQIMKETVKILEDKKIKIRGQNLVFDSAFMQKRYGAKICQYEDKIHDTMIMQGTIMPDYFKGLDFICSVHTDIPYYKADGKRWIPVEGKAEQGWMYNNEDHVATFEASKSLMRGIKKQKNEDAYNRKRAVVGPLVFMMNHGIKVDMEGIRKFRAEEEEKCKELQKKLDELVGMKLNANSHKQVKNYFLVVKGYKAKKKRGKISFDKDILKMIKGEYKSKEADLILKIRKIIKLNSYLVEEKFDKEEDGSYRIRCSYNPVGTRFSRLSSSKNIFGTGTNLQNWSHVLQQFLLSDDGYVGYPIDLSQAENRIVAYVGRVEKLINAFEAGVDVHSLTASWILDKDIKDISREDGSSPLGDKTESERSLPGKKSNHSLGYDIGVNEFATRCEISKIEAKFIYNGWHGTYPEVKKNYHTEIRTQILRDKTLTNLMGRKTMFLGQICTKLFKEAYSCIPQGTVGDIIDERGLSFVYYNDDFSEVQLLAQIHDEYVCQIPLSLPWKEHARLLRKMKKELEIPLITKEGRSFVIPADIEMVKRFKHGVKIKEVPENDEEFGRILRNKWREVEKLEQGRGG